MKLVREPMAVMYISAHIFESIGVKSENFLENEN